MRKITKNTEPKAWTQYRLTPGAAFKPIPELVNSLLDEQGYICAYCERRIPCKDAVEGTPGAENHRIEHLRTQSTSKKTGISTDLDYSNMVVCCPGNIARDGAENYHCDKRKGDVDLRISPLDDTMMSTIQFTPSGLIKSTDSQLDREINENLNLNQQLLRSNRKETWIGIARGLKAKDWNVSNIRHLIDVWESKHKENINGHMVLAYKPYCSMVLYMLNKKLNMINGK